jgi:septum site-determining protein MinC
MHVRAPIKNEVSRLSAMNDRVSRAHADRVVGIREHSQRIVVKVEREIQRAGRQRAFASLLRKVPAPIPELVDEARERTGRSVPKHGDIIVLSIIDAHASRRSGYTSRAERCRGKPPNRGARHRNRSLSQESAFEIRFGQVGLAQMRLRTADPEAIHAELTARAATAPSLFERAAVCLDFSALEREPESAQVRALIEAIRRAGLLPIGFAHGTAAVEALAREFDVPVLTQFRTQTRPAPRPAEPAAVEAPPAAPTLMHHRPVRSGQRLYARHRDLVVTTAVGAGAEVMADGCVHIYGSLRGRAMAGARGEVTARVFCQEFHAELISIAGVFRVFETIPAELVGQPVQAWLDGDDLRLARIG